MIIFVGGKAFNIIGLTGEQWGYSIFFGFLSIPIGAIIRLIPDELIRKLVSTSFLKQQNNQPQVTVEDEEQFYFPQPLSDVKEELTFLKRMKGGRINNLVFAIQHPRETFITRSRSGSRSRSNSIPRTPTESNGNDSFEVRRTPESWKRTRYSNRSRSNSALGATAVMAGIIAGSVAGWSPVERGYSDNDSLRYSRARAPSDLSSREGVEVQPQNEV